MKKALIFLFMLVSFSAFGQLYKSTGVLYFVDKSALDTWGEPSTYGSEIAMTINTQEIYKWDGVSAWVKVVEITQGSGAPSGSPGTNSKLYLDVDTGNLYRWTGSAWSAFGTAGSATWGAIAGTLSDQTDLNNALGAKSDTSHTHTESDIADLDHYDSTDFDSDFSGKTTDDLAEGANKYYPNADSVKLAGIEANATADLSAGEIKTLYESNANTNPFTDAEQSKLSLIEASATADQTDGEIETAYNNQVDVVSQVDAEAGTSTNVYRWTPLRVAQAIAALGGGGGGTDDQTIDTLRLTGTVLEISIEGDGQPLQTVDLASLQDGTGTDSQGLTWVDGTNTMQISGGASATVTGFSETGHTHATTDVTSGTFADARISESSVTQHEGALTITESQISDLDHYTDSDIDGTESAFDGWDKDESDDFTWDYDYGDLINAPDISAIVHDTAIVIRSEIPIVSDEAYGATWNGNTTDAPSKNAVYDQVQAIIGGAADGDGIYDGNGTVPANTVISITDSLTIGSIKIAAAAIWDIATLNGNVMPTATDTVALRQDLHDAVTLSGTPDYLTIAGQVITRNQIDLTSDVTGVLPSGNIGSHTHATTDITSGTFADARISESSVTQHEGALSITESQISDLDHFTGADITGSETAFSGWDKNAADDFDGAFSSLSGIPAGLSDGDDNTQLTQEQVEDFVGALIAGGTHQLISPSYIDASGVLNFDVESDLSLYDNGTSGFLTSEVDGSITNELQTIDTLSLSGTTLTIAMENDGEAPYTVDLAGLQDGTGTDDQTLDVSSFDGTSISLSIENDGEATKTIDISSVVTTARVTAAGALMDSEVDADLKTFSLPANATMTTFGESLIDDADAATARTTLDVDQAGTDNSTNVTLTGTPDYITIAGQVITRGLVNLSTDITGTLDEGNIDPDIARDSEIPTVSDVAYDATSWNGNTDAATKNAIRDKIESLPGGHDAVTLAGAYDYLTLSSQEITLGQIDLTTDVTGLLPGANIANDLTESQISDLDHFTGADITGSETAFSGWDKNAADDFDGVFSSLSGIPAGLSDGDDDTQLTQEQVEDFAGGMNTGNTETLITVTYQDADGTIDYVVDNDLANYDNSTSNFSTGAHYTDADIDGTESAFTGWDKDESDDGDVVGPASATDNRIARYDGTTGKLIQTSNIEVQDDSDILGVASLSLSGNINMVGGATVDGVDVSGIVSFPGFSSLLTDYGFTDNSSNWNTAFGWGDHSTEGYLTSETDGSVSNEGSLTVAAGTSTTSVINSNTSGSTGVTLTAGTGLSIAEAGNVITLTNTVTDTDNQTAGEVNTSDAGGYYSTSTVEGNLQEAGADIDAVTPPTVNTQTSGSINFNSKYNDATIVNMTGLSSITMTLSNPVNGGAYIIIFTNADDGDTVTWPGTVKDETGASVGTGYLSTTRRAATLIYDGTNYYLIGHIE